MAQIAQTSLQLPFLNPDRLTRAVHTVPAYRKGGPKLNHQIINNKHFFHNYGYGAASVSQLYGAAFLATKSFNIFIDPSTHPSTAVIGAGISGLMTAIELITSGKLVTVYAETIPQFNQTQSAKILSSQGIPHVWMPKEYDWSQDELKHELVSKLSYDFYKNSINLNKYQSIKKIKVFDRHNSVDDLQQVVTEYVFNTFKQAKLRYSNGVKEQGAEYDTLFINSRLLVEQLRVEAILRGVKFVQRKFNNIEDLCSLSEVGIFNCTGKASSYLFGDNNFVEQPTLVLQFQEAGEHKHQFVLKGSNKKQNFDLFCVGKKTYLVAPSKCKGLDKTQIKGILNSASNFISGKNLSAKL